MSEIWATEVQMRRQNTWGSDETVRDIRVTPSTQWLFILEASCTFFTSRLRLVPVTKALQIA